MSKLSGAKVIQILKDHSIQYKQTAPHTIEVLDVWTCGGKTFESWMLCPMEPAELKKWLGY